MRPSFRPAAALVLATALCTSACAPADPEPPAPEPSATALFASDEEALAAAEEAYRKYQHVSDSIYIDGGKDPERLLDVATQSKYEFEKDGYEKVLGLGYYSTGGSTFDSAELLEREEQHGIETFSVFLCEDITAVDIRDSNDKSVVSDERPDRLPLVVSFASAPQTSQLLVAATENWEGENSCRID